MKREKQLTPDSRCMICNSKLKEVDLKTDWENLGETTYMKCDKCDKVFAYPVYSKCPILLSGDNV